MRELLISASGVHTGGGFVLLKALLAACGDRLKGGVYDARARDDILPLVGSSAAEFVEPSVLERTSALFRLARSGTSQQLLLCFNSMPPPIRAQCKVVVYVQAPHFARLNEDASYPVRTRLRLSYEKAWFRLFSRNVDETWVQTESVARALERLGHNKSSIRVRPFVDEFLKGRRAPHERRPSALDPTGAEFFYPADGVGHKNHRVLFDAWRLLADEGIRPTLTLTLNELEFSRLNEPDPLDGDSTIRIRSIGRISREQVIQRLKESTALIFPSLAETLGLPLIEAAALDIPIVASERDFVRDVCVPTVTFDPLSSTSVARAVKRFLGIEEPSATLYSSEAFVAELLK